MGFTKKAALNEIVVAMKFKINDERAEGTITEATVVHTFRLPTAKEREAWRNNLSHVRNGKQRVTYTAACQVLWRECILSVEGYDDIEGAVAGEPFKDKEKMFAYFSDEMGKLHIDSAIGILNQQITEEEVDLEKKSKE